MSEKGIIRRGSGDRLLFWCPGCEEYHAVMIGEGSRPRWTFNGDFERPTLVPSILVRSGHYVDGKKDCWCTYEERLGRPSPFHCRVCHSFVRDGSIQFLNDCTHALAGKTVPLTEEPPD